MQKGNGMRPIYKILANSKDITDRLQGRLLSLAINDEVGLVSDSLSMEIEDRENRFEIPKTGAELEIFIGYKETQLYSMGKFMIDEIELSGPPDKITITGRSANSNNIDDMGSFKAPTNHSWDKCLLSDIISTICQKYNLKDSIDSHFDSLFIEHIDQTDESDLSFIQRLASDYGAIIKIAGGKLLFIEPTKGTFPDGSNLPTVRVDYNDISNYRMRISERGKYEKVVAKYYDMDLAEEQKIEAGEGSPVFSIRETFNDMAKAQKRAESTLKDNIRGKYSLNVNMQGNPLISAEIRMDILNARKEISDIWIVSKCNHTLDSSGYKTEVEGNRPTKE
ncbi:MAG: contractile injection system protein, VgrG/Pvc8 family [Alphaproteobacteria bacterium]|jgi:phage protein D|nr:contractile injection system protein, VgrG/Pvc8 family [Alphaproteobacteria bacterium]